MTGKKRGPSERMWVQEDPTAEAQSPLHDRRVGQKEREELRVTVLRAESLYEVTTASGESWEVVRGGDDRIELVLEEPIPRNKKYKLLRAVREFINTKH